MSRIPPALKIFFSAVFVLLIAFFIVRGCLPKKEVSPVGPHKKIVIAPKPAKKPVVSKPTGRAEMAIILDDWGNNYNLLKKAIAIRRPLTIAILPNLEHSRQIAEEAHAAGIGVMLHMPMQPKSNRQDLEPGTIKTTTSDADIARLLDRAIASVPFLDGVNNHMGSAATGDERVMRAVLNHLKKKNLFFIDSATISTTVAPKIAVETGIRFARRDVFIDNEANSEAIKNQLRDAAKKALVSGRVVVIGHDKTVTLEAISEMTGELEAEGIKLVYAKDLVAVKK